MKSYDLKELSTANKKVDKVTGKDLSSNDFNSAYKTFIDNLDSNGVVGGVVATSTDNTAYTANFGSVSAYKHGIVVAVLNNKNATNNANATLNINGLGAKPIYYKNQAIKSGEFPYRSVSLFLYVTWTAFNSGSGAWVLLDTPDTTYSADNSTLQLSNNVFSIKDSGVSTAKLASNSVTSDKISNGTIVNDDIANTTITGGKLANNTVTATQIANNTITVNKIANAVSLTAIFTDGSSSNYKLLPGS